MPDDPQTMVTSPHLKAAKKVHFTGIKGVGMTAAALCVQDLGITISGSDTQDDHVTAEVLGQRHIDIQVGFDAAHIPEGTDILIYTGAHGGSSNPEVEAAHQRGIRVISHAQAVGELMEGKIGISICGVGGKTSISAMVANILDYAGWKPSFLIGVGKVLNLQVPGRMSEGNHFIAEADEYVVSPGIDNTPRFMHHTPKVIICTNIVHDHPDVYASIEDTKKAFTAFFAKIPTDGLIIANGNSTVVREMDLKSLPVVYYGEETEGNDWWVKENFIGEGKQLVTIASKTGETFNLTLTIPGLFNAHNALSAYIAAKHLGVDHEMIVEGLQLFRGSKRRFEKVGERGGINFYDDYAHHPTQVLVTLEAARQWLPLSRLVIVFQPHTYSRTKTLLDQFAKSFGYADEVIITDIYSSAREKPDPTITGYSLAEAIKEHQPATTYVPHENLVNHLKKTIKPGDAVFTLGAGDIYRVHEELL